MQLSGGENELTVTASDKFGNESRYSAVITSTAGGYSIPSSRSDSASGNSEMSALEKIFSPDGFLWITLSGALCLMITVYAIVFWRRGNKKTKPGIIMNKAKSVCRQIFLYLLFAISAAVTVCSAILFGKANGAVSTKEFIDTAADSVDSAYALIEKRDMYAGMLKISIAACIVTALMIVLWHVIHRIIKKKKSAGAE